jgi:hypothetical protein
MGKRKKIDCPICKNKRSFSLENIENTTETDVRLFDSKGLNNMIELYTTNNINLETIYIPLRIKLKKLQIIPFHYNKIVSKTNEKITFHVFEPDYPITYYYICEWFNGCCFRRYYISMD